MEVNHSHFLDIGENVGYDDTKREYFIVVKKLGPGESMIASISFCPVCGERFPLSLRNEWFDRLKALGVDPFKDIVPTPYADGTWWRNMISD